MKKHLAIALIVIIALSSLSLTGCGKGDSNSDDKASQGSGTWGVSSDAESEDKDSETTDKDTDPGSPDNDPAATNDQPAEHDPRMVGYWQTQSGNDVFQILRIENIEFFTVGIVLEADGTAAVICSSRGDIIKTDFFLQWETRGNTFVILKDGAPLKLDGTDYPLQGTYSASDGNLTLTLDDGPTIVLIPWPF